MKYDFDVLWIVLQHVCSTNISSDHDLRLLFSFWAWHFKDKLMVLRLTCMHMGLLVVIRKTTIIKSDLCLHYVPNKCWTHKAQRQKKFRTTNYVLWFRTRILTYYVFIKTHAYIMHEVVLSLAFKCRWFVGFYINLK